MQEQVVDKAEHIADLVTKVGAGIAVAPGAASILSIEWWNENSAGIVAMCAAVGAGISVASFLFGLWHSGKIGRVLERMKIIRRRK